MASNKNRVCVVGLGYVGLPTAALLAARGFSVAGVDINAAVVERINAGAPHIVEPELATLVADAVAGGNLDAAVSPRASSVFVIATPTPIRAGNLADITAVEAAAQAIAPVLTTGNLVIIESTCPVGTTATIARLLARLRPDLSFPQDVPERSDIHLAYCPERVLPGQTLRELVGNDRIVGGLDARSGRAARAFYRRFVDGDIAVTSANAAELSKLLENAYRDVNIAFANEVSLVCDHFGLDPWEVIDLANHHPRVNILRPGPGVGGHCIPVDPWFIHEAAPELTPLIATARGVNDRKPDWVVKKVRKAARKTPGKPIALLGLAYKPNVDDLRGSPAIAVARQLAADKGAELLVAEPHIQDLPPALAGIPGVRLCGHEEAIARAGVVVVLCNHDAFGAIPRTVLAGKALIDPVGLFAGAGQPASTPAASEDACAQAS